MTRKLTDLNSLCKTSQFLCLLSAASFAALVQWSSRTDFPSQLALPYSSGCSISMPLRIGVLLQQLSTVVPICDYSGRPCTSRSCSRLTPFLAGATKHAFARIVTSNPRTLFLPIFLVGVFGLVKFFFHLLSSQHSVSSSGALQQYHFVLMMNYQHVADSVIRSIIIPLEGKLWSQNHNISRCNYIKLRFS